MFHGTLKGLPRVISNRALVDWLRAICLNAECVHDEQPFPSEGECSIQLSYGDIVQLYLFGSAGVTDINSIKMFMLKDKKSTSKNPDAD